MIYDCIIIGGGTAGITAAVYLARGGCSVLIFEKMFIGGQIVNAPLIENLPGFAGGIIGADYALNLKKQAESLNIPVKYENVTALEPEGGEKKVITEKAEYSAKNIILAMGSEHKKLGIKEEEEYIGRGVSYCAVCDGAFYKGKTAAVAGGGNSAAREALYLADICSKVYLIHRREFLRAERALIKSLEEKENIEIIYNANVLRLEGKPLEKIILATESGEREISSNALFIAIGSAPQSLIADKKILNAAGYIMTDENMQTAISGVYAAGDIRAENKKQLVFAAADGALAAENILKA